MLDAYFIRSLLSTVLCIGAFLSVLIAVVFYSAWSALALLAVALFLLAWFYKFSSKAGAMFDEQGALSDEKPLSSAERSQRR